MAHLPGAGREHPVPFCTTTPALQFNMSRVNALVLSVLEHAARVPHQVAAAIGTLAATCLR